ncbi:MAG TPA: hypothetical protein VMR45_01195 [Patescibacteria group bacterium]|nr:hypothetical protein [Patescibacteria group bacterium]
MKKIFSPIFLNTLLLIQTAAYIWSALVQYYDWSLEGVVGATAGVAALGVIYLGFFDVFAFVGCLAQKKFIGSTQERITLAFLVLYIICWLAYRPLMTWIGFHSIYNNSPQ